MLLKLPRIFRRYADAQLALRRTNWSPAGTPTHRVDGIALDGNRLHVTGRSPAAEVALTMAKARTSTRPGTDGTFTLDLPWAPGEAVLAFDGAPIALPNFPPARVAIARQLLWVPFLIELTRLLPTILRWKRQGDMGAREIVKQRLGLVPRSHAAVLDPQVLSPAPDAVPFDRVTIILPVYDAFDLLREALDRVDRHTDLPWHMILVEDASTDARIRPALRDWAAARPDAVTLLENETNLGFVGAVNRGLEAARGRDAGAPVVLLNSDAMVPRDWARRLLAPLADPTIASVTPMSNDAEIFGVPVICAPRALPPGAAEAIDRGARDLSGPVEAPTGVGFCMALAPRFLAQLPAFDPAFGRGYGEETDWCQKARALGGRHVAIPNLFVEHLSGASFGSADKTRLLLENGAEITRRYPRYDDEVQTFLRDDPLTTARLALALDWAAATAAGPVPVYLAHAMGGGAETWLQGRLAADLESIGCAAVLRVGQGHRFQLELHAIGGATRGLTDDGPLIRDLVGRLPDRRIVYSCGVGDRDATGLPGLLLSLAGRGAAPVGPRPQPVEVLFHDFFPISPSYTLLGADGAYRGVPRPGTPLADDPAHMARRADGHPCPLPVWQAAWGDLMTAADRITVFSESSRTIVAEVWPDTAPRITVHPHVPRPMPRIDAAAGPRPVIGVLGNIGHHKGAAVVQAVARRIGGADMPGLVVLGAFDPDYHLPRPARCHGGYRPEDLPGLVPRYGITHWAIPSIWPETFSFTTHEALATGMPVLTFALGAQGDAVAAASNGTALPLRGDPATDAATLLAAITGLEGTP